MLAVRLINSIMCVTYGLVEILVSVTCSLAVPGTKQGHRQWRDKQLQWGHPAPSPRNSTTDCIKIFEDSRTESSFNTTVSRRRLHKH